MAVRTVEVLLEQFRSLTGGVMEVTRVVGSGAVDWTPGTPQWLIAPSVPVTEANTGNSLTFTSSTGSSGAHTAVSFTPTSMPSGFTFATATYKVGAAAAVPFTPVAGVPVVVGSVASGAQLLITFTGTFQSSGTKNFTYTLSSAEDADLSVGASIDVANSVWSGTAQWVDSAGLPVEAWGVATPGLVARFTITNYTTQTTPTIESTALTSGLTVDSYTSSEGQTFTWPGVGNSISPPSPSHTYYVDVSVTPTTGGAKSITLTFDNDEFAPLVLSASVGVVGSPGTTRLVELAVEAPARRSTSSTIGAPVAASYSGAEVAAGNIAALTAPVASGWLEDGISVGGATYTRSAYVPVSFGSGTEAGEVVVAGTVRLTAVSTSVDPPDLVDYTVLLTTAANGLLTTRTLTVDPADDLGVDVPFYIATYLDAGRAAGLRLWLIPTVSAGDLTGSGYGVSEYGVDDYGALPDQAYYSWRTGDVRWRITPLGAEMSQGQIEISRIAATVTPPDIHSVSGAYLRFSTSDARLVP